MGLHGFEVVQQFVHPQYDAVIDPKRCGSISMNKHSQLRLRSSTYDTQASVAPAPHTVVVGPCPTVSSSNRVPPLRF